LLKKVKVLESEPVKVGVEWPRKTFGPMRPPAAL
jgi:hypothetical protein